MLEIFLYRCNIENCTKKITIEKYPIISKFFSCKGYKSESLCLTAQQPFKVKGQLLVKFKDYNKTFCHNSLTETFDFLNLFNASKSNNDFMQKVCSLGGVYGTEKIICNYNATNQESAIRMAIKLTKIQFELLKTSTPYCAYKYVEADYKEKYGDLLNTDENAPIDYDKISKYFITNEHEVFGN